MKSTKIARWSALVIAVLLLLAFVPSAYFKISHHPMAIEGMRKMGIPLGYIAPIGIVELLCLALYLIPRTAVLGAFLVTGYLGGAVLANIIAGTDFLHALVIGLLVWTGALLRVPSLRGLLPVLQVRQVR